MKIFLKQSFVVLLFLPYLLLSQDIDSSQFYLQRFQYDKALKYINNQPKINNQSQLYNKAQALKGLNKFDEALNIFLEIALDDTVNGYLDVQIAECYKNMGIYDKAINYYKSANKLNNPSKYVKLQIANCFFNSGKYEHAVDHYHQLILKDTTYYLAKQIAKCYYNNEFELESIPYFEIAIDKNPFDKQSIKVLAKLLLKYQFIAHAINITEHYIQIDSADADINFLYALGHYKFRNYEKAINAFHQCMAMNDSSFSVHKYLGYTYFKNQDYYEAVPHLQLAADIDTIDIELNFTLGETYLKIMQPNCIYYFQRVIDVLTPIPDQLLTLHKKTFEAYLGMAQNKNAKQSILKIEKIFFDTIFSKSKSNEELLKLADEIRYMYFQINDIEKTVHWIDWLISQKPGDYRLMYQKADLYSKYLNNKKLELECYEKVLKMTDNTLADSNKADPFKQHIREFSSSKVKLLKEELFFE